MAPAPRDTYFENEVLTATPQKLHLMLIEAAIRLGNQTLEHWRESRETQAIDSIVRCQRILAQMLKGLRPALMPELVGQVARVYIFVYRNLVQAQVQRDPARLNDAIRVLEIERETWRKVCEKLGGSRASARPIPAPHAATSRFSLEA
jgi:flagellar secretion chaperone FliS